MLELLKPLPIVMTSFYPGTVAQEQAPVLPLGSDPPSFLVSTGSPASQRCCCHTARKGSENFSTVSAQRSNSHASNEAAQQRDSPMGRLLQRNIGYVATVGLRLWEYMCSSRCWYAWRLDLGYHYSLFQPYVIRLCTWARLTGLQSVRYAFGTTSSLEAFIASGRGVVEALGLSRRQNSSRWFFYPAQISSQQLSDHLIYRGEHVKAPRTVFASY